ncbi:hypothetical protein ACFQH6_12230 [Halobacteriaceae archaeon GCM10025711]
MRFPLVVAVFRAMLREEWRLHATLFGGRRFALFPLTIAGLVLAGGYMLARSGLDAATIHAGTLAFALVLGLQTGTVGFESDDAVENLLGDVTLLLFSARTLPLSPRTLVTVFLVKDVAYYAVLFLLPLSVGATLGPVLAAGAVAGSIGASLALWPATVVAFTLGVGGSLLASGVLVRRPALVAGVGLAVLAGLALAFGPFAAVGSAVVAASTPPYSPLAVGVAVAGTLTVLVAGVRQFDVSADHRRHTVARDEYAWLTRRLGDGPLPSLVAKTLVDVHRSSGGVWKLVVSSAVLIVSVHVVLDVVTQWFPLTPLPGVVFGVLLSATAFPTYAWLTRVDDVADYRFYPVDSRRLLVAKAWAFALLEAPVALVYYAGVSVLARPGLGELLVGGVLLAGAAVYVFAVTVRVAGFRPNDALFDGVVFTKFTLAVMPAFLLPLVAGFVLPELTILTGGVLALYGAGLGGGGVLLFRREITG